MLQEDGALAPGAAFQDGVTPVVVGDGVLDGGVPVPKVLGSQHPAVAAAGGVQDLGVGEEAAGGLGDEAFVPGVSGGGDAGFAGGTGGLLQQAFPEVG